MPHVESASSFRLGPALALGSGLLCALTKGGLCREPMEKLCFAVSTGKRCRSCDSMNLYPHPYLATFRRQAADAASEDGSGAEASDSSTPLAATARSVSLPKLSSGGGGAAAATVRTEDGFSRHGAHTAQLKRSKEAEARAWKELAGMRQAVQKARAQAAQRDFGEVLD